LTLYWTTNNLCSIAQYRFTYWMLGPPPNQQKQEDDKTDPEDNSRAARRRAARQAKQTP